MIRWQAMIAIILIIALLLTGCYTTKNIPVGDNLPRKTTTVDGVVLTTGDTVYFRDHDGTFDPVTGHVIGFAIDGSWCVYNTGDIEGLILRKKEPISWTVAGVLVVAGLVTAVAAVIAASIHDEDWWWRAW
jgi:hypothetical protein